MNTYIKWFTGATSAVLCCLASAAVGIQSIESIETSVSDFLMNETVSDVNVKVSTLDKRLRLDQCPESLTHHWAGDSESLGRVTVLTSCESDKPWRVHVQATLSRVQNVWTLSRAVRRGETLVPEMGIEKQVVLGGKDQRIVRARAPVTQLDTVLGYEFVQNVDAGSILAERMLKPRNLVVKGERVLIRHDTAGVKLQTHGIAVSDGAIDQRIQIKNISSGKVVDARVTGLGVAETLF